MLSIQRTLSSRTNGDLDAVPQRDDARSRPALVCRQIRADDLDAAVACLARGFHERKAAYWRRALLRLREREVPVGRPRYGYVLTADGIVVGIVLVIFATTDTGDVRANVSSWYVDAAYRGYSNLLLATAFRAKDVTFINISPARSTIPTIVAQGFTRYVDGSFHALAALSGQVPGARVREIVAGSRGAPPLLVEHAACGCICLEITHAGEVHPFVFVPMRSARNVLPSAQLVYCRTIADFVRFAGPLGRRLARLGLVSVMIDAQGPIPGLVGRYAPGRRIKFYRGSTAPRLGDLSGTELVYLGP